jgi:hypothetical protein
MAAQEANHAAQVEKLKNSVRSFKGAYTRKEKAGIKLIDHMNTSPSDEALENLRSINSQLQVTCDKILELYIQLQQLDPEQWKEYGKRADEAIDLHGAIQEILLPAIHRGIPQTHPVQPPVPQPAAAVAVRPRVNDALKPDKLTRDFNPTEFRSWVRKFRAFYTTSHLERCTIEEQQCYFYAYIDVHLETKLKTVIRVTTPIFGDTDSCISALTEEFLLKYPLFSRRLDFFRCQQTPKQPFSDFIVNLKQKGDEADLADLTVDELYMFRYVCGCTNEKLQEKLLKLNNPTLEDMEHEILNYKIAQNAIKSIEKESSSRFAQAAKIHQPGYNKGKGRGKFEKPNTHFRSQRKPNDLKGKCY